jgi:ubiquinone/menaquinone biosynthesis C-methylase UbiE
MEVQNPFKRSWAASRYAAARPNIHDQVVDHIQRALPASLPRETALDIGCGTGLSTIALTPIASLIVGVDISQEMLLHALLHPRLRYVQANGECLPLSNKSFDLVTVGCAFHWCHPRHLLDEIYRVIRPEAMLVIYDNGFLGPDEAFPEYERWHREAYQSRFPAPHRRPHFHPFMTSTTGFRVISSEYLQQVIPFSASELASYLTTQSNVVAAVDQGREVLEEVDRWLQDELAGLFESRACHAGETKCGFSFGGYVSYLRAAK